jgi:hypothetical protein
MQRSDIVRPTALATVGQTSAFLARPKTPRGLIILGMAIIAAGLALGWNWVVALGLAPLILSVAPCAAMCALGACAMMKGGSGSPKPPEPANPPTQE